MTRLLMPMTALLLLATPAVSGETSPDQAVAYRHAYFEALGKHMKGAGAIAKGQVDRPGDYIVHAKAIAAMAPILHELFPAGTGPDAVKETDALPVVWTDKKGFEAKAKSFADAAAAFVAAAETGDAEKAKGAFFGVGKSCGDCHDTFRKDEH